MNFMKVLKLVGSSIIDRPLEIIDNQLKFYQERQNAEHAQKLKQDEMKFLQKMELDNRKLNVEIDDMITTKELERGKKVLETIANYQKTMSESAVSIGNSLELMTVEVRRQAHDLIQDKKQVYQKMQEDATARAMEQLENIHKKFPEGSKARDIMEDAVGKQINGIVENSIRFIQMIDDDFAKMTDNIDSIAKEARKNADDYISMTFNRSMTGQLQGSNDIKLLK